MAVKRVNYFSDCLRRRVEYHVALPRVQFEQIEQGDVSGVKSLKVLMLLHGYCEMGLDFLEKTNIEELAEKYQLCVILPNGENSFYLDGKATGREYGRYVGEEILLNARETLGLSREKADTFIGGTSMGGFGAVHTGFLYPENYSGIFVMSGALIMDFVAAKEASIAHSIANQEYYDLMFGPAEELLGSANDPRNLIRDRIQKGEELPRLYVTCGTSDFMIEQSRQFHAFLEEVKMPHTYVEGEGAHDFTFWNHQLEPAIKGVLAV